MSATSDGDWTKTDLDLLHSMDKAGLPVDQMARRLGRTEDAIAGHLAEVRARTGPVRFPGERIHSTRQDWQGPDEEGDAPLPTGKRADDTATWVHIDPEGER
ncbi:hypothetical protein SAMN06295912_13816 [Sphingomonas laterariae]|uniref:Uncharacterized protein n=1 Tax=Edaphosphingomonas laterariae TaxID=861865 RepID=A0A239JR90_9SPHN|nr:hypothetical protein [Sphingomonas laterariae]SNT08401.1 hypothetical protein SAMN06295912_13816 [Sphingomonas laterariae]